MKKKRNLPQCGNNPLSNNRSESDYEALRSAVTEGEALRADKTIGLTVFVAYGAFAWIRQGQCTKEVAPPDETARAHGHRHSAEYLVMLLANLVEAHQMGNKQYLHGNAE